MSQKKLKVGVLGATGMVGQRFVALLEDHPLVRGDARRRERQLGRPAVRRRGEGALGARDADPGRDRRAHREERLRRGRDRRAGRLRLLRRRHAEGRDGEARGGLRAARDAGRLEQLRAPRHARRADDDPEVNPEHAAVIEAQRKRLGTTRGFIAVKPNCSIQSYVPAIHPLLKFGPKRIAVCTYQAISGAGKTFETWPEMIDNLIPFIKGEEEKSEQEPMKIWGSVDGRQDREGDGAGHHRAVHPRAGHRRPHGRGVRRSSSEAGPKAEIIERGRAGEPKPLKLGLPSAPKPFLTYFEDDSRPQTKLDRDIGNGMGVAIGRLRPDALFDYRFVSLSHNTVRGAAGGAVLTAELLTAEGAPRGLPRRRPRLLAPRARPRLPRGGARARRARASSSTWRRTSSRRCSPCRSRRSRSPRARPTARRPAWPSACRAWRSRARAFLVGRLVAQDPEALARGDGQFARAVRGIGAGGLPLVVALRLAPRGPVLDPELRVRRDPDAARPVRGGLRDRHHPIAGRLRAPRRGPRLAARPDAHRGAARARRGRRRDEPRRARGGDRDPAADHDDPRVALVRDRSLPGRSRWGTRRPPAPPA